MWIVRYVFCNGKVVNYWGYENKRDAALVAMKLYNQLPDNTDILTVEFYRG